MKLPLNPPEPSSSRTDISSIPSSTQTCQSGKEEGVEVVVTKFCQIFYLSYSSWIMGFCFVSRKYFAHSVIRLFTATRAAARKSCHFTQPAAIFTAAVHCNPWADPDDAGHYIASYILIHYVRLSVRPSDTTVPRFNLPAEPVAVR
jgi:hypothetical protein